jgi:hypothetical protein
LAIQVQVQVQAQVLLQVQVQLQAQMPLLLPNLFSDAPNKLNGLYVANFADSPHLGTIDGFSTVNFRQNPSNRQTCSY